MREWKFRGYDAVGKKGWVYGDLTHTKKVVKEEPYLVDRVEVAHYEVYPESVGLFTGKKDRKDSEIFEGDRVAVYYKGRLMNVGTIIWHEGTSGFVLLDDDGFYSPIVSQVSEVVGNIFDKTNDKL